MKKKYDFSKAKKGKVLKELKVSKTIRLDADVIEWLVDSSEKEGIGYQTYLNSLLKKLKNSHSSFEDRLSKIEKEIHFLKTA